MSAFGHAGFGSSNRRNQLRAQGQIGADTYGQGVRNAMQAPTMNIYSTPQTYQQATGQPAQQQPSAPAAQPASQPSMAAYSPPPSPGLAQPIPPQSTGTPYTQAEVPQQSAASQGGVDPRSDAGFAQWSGYKPGQASSPAIERMEKAALDQWMKWTPAQRAAAAAGVGQQRYSPEYATQLEAAYGEAQKQQDSTARFKEIQDLRRQLSGGTSAQDDDILYRLNTLEGGPQVSREDFLRDRQAERDNAPLAAQQKDREKFIDEWMQEQRRANMTPAEYQQSRQRNREFARPKGTMQNDPYIFAGQHRGNPASLDAEMARRFYERQAAQRNDAASQEQFLAEWQGPRSFEEWYAQRYGEDAKQKWNLL